MAYQALLFCPEEKTARTVTQVLGELEFQVDPCTEPFAAVKKLMSQHFDAVVVDCDNEQNATLLFKSARNSTSNQASLAVAIVEGQAGVAKAFRIGANLVLTKPINVEQSKGTLRVARGLLRKGEPVKPGAPTASVPAAPAKPAPAVSAIPTTPAKPAAPKSAAPIKTETPAAPMTTAAPRPASAPAAKPAAAPVPPRAVAAPAARTVSAPRAESVASRPVGSHATPASIAPSASTVPPAVTVPPTATPAASKPAVPEGVPRTLEAAQAASMLKPKFVGAPEGPAGVFGMSGAASAPAPAREVPPPPKTEAAPQPARHAAEDLFDKPAAAATAAEPWTAATTGSFTESAPSFTFGGANAPEHSTGAVKKLVLIGAFGLIVVGAYFGWDYIQNRHSHPSASANATSPANTSAPASVPPAAAPAAKPAAPTPASPQPEPNSSAPDITLTSTSGNSSGENEAPSTPVPSPSKPAISPAPEKNLEPKEVAPAPLVVKGGSAPVVSHSSPPVTDTAAPSVVGIAATGSDGALSNIVGGATAPQPVLQTVNISQGVSSGLIIKRVQPIYPKAALAMRIEGAVELQATISKAGEITGVKVLKGDPQLSRAAAEAVKQWKYKPYLLNGEPVEIQTQVTVNFRLPH